MSHEGHDHEHDHEHEGHEHMSEEEMRARLEEELRRITVRDVLLQTIVSLVNLGGQRLGLTPDTEDLRDLEQARLAIEGVRALLPILEEQDAEQMRPVREALSQLQMAYAQLARSEGGAGAGGAPEGPAPDEAPRQRPAPGPAGPGAPADCGCRRARRPSSGPRSEPLEAGHPAATDTLRPLFGQFGGLPPAAALSPAAAPVARGRMNRYLEGSNT